MSKLRNIIYIVLFFALILGVWVSISFFVQQNSIEFPASRGYYDLSDKDFSNTVYHAENDWESWPEAYYTPEDFANGTVPDAPQFFSAEVA